VKKKQVADKRLQWWREARFGMFIHFGLYSQAAGGWNGGRFDNFVAEWIMASATIPYKEYSKKLTAVFNPTSFSAREIVALAKNAGMKYLVITAKHSEGFAMFRSQHPYNIVTATPYGKDPMEELARECREAGVKLCFYYSQVQDWQHPDAAGNTWDYPDIAAKKFDRYLDEKVKPQLRELLTQYGPVGLIWFDTPLYITKKQSLDLKKFVRGLQPDCLVSGRIGNGVGDYGSLGDNEFARGKISGDWESPATINDTWGFSSTDHNWKSTRELLSLLAGSASCGANYLLNIGPEPSGVVPLPSVERLMEIGHWLELHGEAIYGSSAGPVCGRLEWGWLTRKAGVLYLLIDKWPTQGKFFLSGLQNVVHKAALLGETPQSLEFKQVFGRNRKSSDLEITVPLCAPDNYISVVRLEVSGEIPDFKRKKLVEMECEPLLSANQSVSGCLTITNPFLCACRFELEVEQTDAVSVEIQKDIRIAAGRKTVLPLTLSMRKNFTGLTPVSIRVLREGMSIGGIETVCYDTEHAVSIPKITAPVDLACQAGSWPLSVFTRDSADHLTLSSSDQGMEWRGPSDLSFNAQVGWQDGICMRLEVFDDFLSVASAGVKDNWSYDSVEIRLAAVPQAGLAELESHHPPFPNLALIVNPAIQDEPSVCTFNDYSRNGFIAVSEFRSRRTATGYLLEGRIQPTPAAGLRIMEGQCFLFELAVNDKDDHPPRSTARTRMSLFCRKGQNQNSPVNWQLCRLTEH
jgi:alpha-L-fucosidase